MVCTPLVFNRYFDHVSLEFWQTHNPERLLKEALAGFKYDREEASIIVDRILSKDPPKEIWDDALTGAIAGGDLDMVKLAYQKNKLRWKFSSLLMYSSKKDAEEKRDLSITNFIKSKLRVDCFIKIDIERGRLLGGDTTRLDKYLNLISNAEMWRDLIDLISNKMTDTAIILLPHRVFSKEEATIIIKLTVNNFMRRFLVALVEVLIIRDELKEEVINTLTTWSWCCTGEFKEVVNTPFMRSILHIIKPYLTQEEYSIMLLKQIESMRRDMRNTPRLSGGASPFLYKPAMTSYLTELNISIQESFEEYKRQGIPIHIIQKEILPYLSDKTLYKLLINIKELDMNHDKDLNNIIDTILNRRPIWPKKEPFLAYYR